MQTNMNILWIQMQILFGINLDNNYMSVWRGLVVCLVIGVVLCSLKELDEEGQVRITPQNIAAIKEIVQAATIHNGDNLVKNAQYVSAKLEEMYKGRWNVYIINSTNNNTDFYFLGYYSPSFCTVASQLNKLHPNWTYQVWKVVGSVSANTLFNGGVDKKSDAVSDDEVNAIRNIILDVEKSCGTNESCIDSAIQQRVMRLWNVSYSDQIMIKAGISFAFNLSLSQMVKWVFLHKTGASNKKVYMIYTTPGPVYDC